LHSHRKIPLLKLLAILFLSILAAQLSTTRPKTVDRVRETSMRLYRQVWKRCATIWVRTAARATQTGVRLIRRPLSMSLCCIKRRFLPRLPLFFFLE